MINVGRHDVQLSRLVQVRHNGELHCRQVILVVVSR